MLEVNLPTYQAGYAYSSALERVIPGKKYVVSVEAIGMSGKPYCAFFGVNLFKGENERIGRRIRWLNDFSGEKKEYLIIFEVPAECNNVRLIYRVNKETPVKAVCQYEILEPEQIRFAEAYSGMADSYDEFDVEPKKEKQTKTDLSSEQQIDNTIPAVKLEVEAAKATQKLVFPESKSPKVSIIVLNYNKGGYTFNCLSSVLRNTEPGTYEVILVDNGSTEEESKKILKKLENVQIFTPSENLGFIRGNNYASKYANGEYLLFLNNDTIVLKGWLDSLLRTFERHDKVGVVGSKLIYPDGTLQEAGSMIWSDGSAKGYGRNVDNPSKPEYHFAREVDFCSGASLIVKKGLFIEIGGFNELYVPAYFEDVDLCFAVRSKGYKVMYNPFSVIVHYEGVSSTRDVHNPTGVKRFELKNRPKFVSLWKDELSKRLPPLQSSILYARDLKKGPAVLVFDGWVPEPDKSTGDIRSFNITNTFSQLGCRVTLYTSNFWETKYADALRELGVEVIPADYIPIEKFLTERSGYYSIVLLNTDRMSFATLKHYFYQTKINNPRGKIVLHIDDLYGYSKIVKKAVLGDQSDMSGDDDVAKLLKEHSFELLDSSDSVFVISEREARIVNDLVGDKAIVIPETREPIPKSQITKFKKRSNSIIYVGGFTHLPNVTSANILVHEIFPKVKAKVPDAKLYIVGNAPPPELADLKDDSIEVTGLVKDLSPYYSIVKVSAPPIIAKGGVKGKIIESLNHCTPVVTSPLGREGTELKDGHDILIGENNDEFANKIISVLEDEKLWNKISRNGRKYFEEHHSHLSAERIVSKFLEEIKVNPNQLGAASEIADRYQVEAPIAILLLVYNERPDLQNAFPEVKNGQYDKLIEWAEKYGTSVDSHKAILLPYKDWFIAKKPQN